MRPGKIDLLTGKAIADTQLPPLDWVVDGLFVHGDRVVVAGESRAYKTWLLLDMALHVAAGRPWLGFEVPKARRVLFIDEEMNERTLIRRTKRIANGSGIDLATIPFVAMSQQGMRFHAEAGKNLLHNLTPFKFDPEFIVVEALVRVLVGTENESEDISQFWRNVIPLTRQPQRTVLFSHHLAKANDQPGVPKRSEADRTRGSGDIMAGADAHLSMTRKWVEGHGENSTLVKAWKSREGEEAKPFSVVMLDAGPHDVWKCVVDRDPPHHHCPVKFQRVQASKPVERPSEPVQRPAGSLFDLPAN